MGLLPVPLYFLLLVLDACPLRSSTQSLTLGALVLATCLVPFLVQRLRGATIAAGLVCYAAVFVPCQLVRGNRT